MKLAAACAIADVVAADGPTAESIVPSMFDRRVVPAAAAAVAAAAGATPE